ncbi:MAG: arylsulfatase [Firmicutes bacterium]|nr:arylsulfatase [Bacillota bacterium]
MKPNIVYILADDMGYGDLSCLNENSKIKTPNLDKMAQNGMVFTDAHASSAVCTPSRYSILTGRYNWRSRLKSGVLGGYSSALIEKERMTVATLLKESGYKTACIGKWHLGMNWKFEKDVVENSGYGAVEGVDYTSAIQNGPTANGFDYFYGISASLDMPPYVYIENDKVVQLPDRETEGLGMEFWRKGPTAPDFKHSEALPKLTQRVLDKIEEYKDEAFFIYFPLTAPHTPILPSDEFVGKSETNSYGDFVLMCDDVVGKVISKLEEKNILDNTIVVFTSDNGCSPAACIEELAAVGHNPSYIFRGYKADIYEGGHRIPLIIQWNDKISNASVCNETVCLVDFMATVADVVGYRLPASAAVDSFSNLPAWMGKNHGTPLREAVVHHSIDGSFSIRKGKWKLEMCPGSGGWGYPKPGEEPNEFPKIQLYDLESDISEKDNVQSKHPQVVIELKELLIKYIKNGRSTPGAPQKNAGGDVWEELKWMEE